MTENAVVQRSKFCLCGAVPLLIFSLFSEAALASIYNIQEQWFSSSEIKEIDKTVLEKLLHSVTSVGSVPQDLQNKCFHAIKKSSVNVSEHF